MASSFAPAQGKGANVLNFETILNGRRYIIGYGPYL